MRPKGTEDRTNHQPAGKVHSSRDCFQTPLRHGLCTGYSNRSGTILAAIGFLLTALLTLTMCLLHFLLKFNVLFGTLNLDYRCISFFLFLSFLKGRAKNISKVPKWAPLKISISLCTQESKRWEPVSNSFTFCVIWRKTDSYIQNGLFQKIVL